MLMGEKVIDGRERLKIIRKEAGNLSQAEFAAMLKLPDHKIKSVEIGKTKISVELALAIEEKFNYNFKWILTGIGERHSELTSKDDMTENSTIHRIELEHCSVIKRFKNKKVAMEVNEKLLDLEAVGEQTFQKAVNFINNLWDNVTVAINEYKSTETGLKGKGVGDRRRNGTTDT